MDVDGIKSFYSLGDINGDGYDDAGFIIWNTGVEPVYYDFYLLMGGEIPVIVLWDSIYNKGLAIRGIGNINNDEFDDFLITIDTGEPYPDSYRNAVVYGNTIIDSVASDTLNTLGDFWFNGGGAYVGDVNGDSADDFIGCFGITTGYGVWFGGSIYDNTPDFIGDHGGSLSAVGYGDLNNDGYSDLVMGNKYWYNYQGKVYFYMGSENANGTVDLDYPAPVITGTQFGSVVAVGDFNNDGYDDAAVGASEGNSWQDDGYVYVYAGNDSLSETTVSINEESTIPDLPGISFSNYPNPFNPTTTISFSLATAQNIELEIYNIRGQLVRTLVKSQQPAGKNSVVWNGTDDSNNPVSSGIYFSRLRTYSVTQSKKLMLLK